MSTHNTTAIPHTFLSRRTRRARYAAGPGRRDWVWLVAFGAAIVIMVGAFFALSGAIGGSSTCAHPLAPLGEAVPLSSQAFQEEDNALALVVERAAANDRAGAESAFYGEVHGFTHNVDEPLREHDAALGKELCHAVLDLEESLTSEISPINLSTRVSRVREILRDASVALGYDRPT
jgi:hypothetical protein